MSPGPAVVMDIGPAEPAEATVSSQHFSAVFTQLIPARWGRSLAVQCLEHASGGTLTG